jgi:hypothetical protein
VAKVTYDKQLTGLLVIDPYNDFISDGGKLWDRLKTVAKQMIVFLTCCRFRMRCGRRGFCVFYALHCRYRTGDYETWKYIAPIQKAAWLRKAFENGTWDGEIRDEFEPQPGYYRGPRTLVFQWLCQQIWICSSKRMAFTSSLSSDSEQIRTWSQRFALPLSLATRSRR